jgi:hypothetical protein
MDEKIGQLPSQGRTCCGTHDSEPGGRRSQDVQTVDRIASRAVSGNDWLTMVPPR